MYCPSFPEAPTMQTLIVCVPERAGHSVSSDSPLDAAIDEGLRGLGAGSDSMRTTPRSGTFREHSPTPAPGHPYRPLRDTRHDTTMHTSQIQPAVDAAVSTASALDL